MASPVSTERTYLDYNATAPLRPEASRAMADALAKGGNASSVHSEGRAARASIEAARAAVAHLVNADPAGVIFTAGGTEANNLAIKGVIGAEGVTRILVCGIEHPSVLEAADRAGVPVRRIAATPDGQIEIADLETALGEDDSRALLCLMLANNETGAIQLVAEVSRLAREHDALVLTDAVQAAGKIETDFRALDVDMMALSGHKLGGPQGAGALVVRDGLKLDPQMLGGGQELKRRAGTENVPAIAGFGAAAVCSGGRSCRCGATRRHARPDGAGDREPVAGRGGIERRCAAAAQHGLSRGAGRQRGVSRDCARSCGFRGELGLGLFLRQGCALTRAGSDGT